MTTNDKTIEKNFAEYITKTYKNIIVNNIKIQDNKEDLFAEQRPVDTNNLLVKTCQGCIEGQPNQQAHTYWGGCLSIYEGEHNEETEDVEDVQEDDDNESYCSTTSYESDGENATTPAIVEPQASNIQLLNLSASSIMVRRAANN
jgi:hypothetical protein